MSRIIWSDYLIPPEDAAPVDLVPDSFFGEHGLKVTNALPLAIKNTDIDIPDRRAYRSMSRVAILMSAVALKAQEALAPFLAENPFRVGLYSAIEAGPIDYPTTHELAQTSKEEFFEKYKKLRSPKMYLKQLPNLAPAQLGIFLKIQGPMCVYNHSSAGGLQTLDQAEFDLHEGRIDAALVCSAFSFEDPLQALRGRQQAPQGKAIAEGAAAILLVKDGERKDWSKEDYMGGDRYYGASHPIIQVATRRKN